MKKLATLLLLVWAFVPTLSFAQGPEKLCFTTDGSNCVAAVQSAASIKIDSAAATTAQIVALSTTKAIFVTSFNLYAAGTGTIKFVYGTGTNCATGGTDLTGAYPMKDAGNISVGSGLGYVLFVPIGKALCITTSATAQISGSLSYAQF